MKKTQGFTLIEVMIVLVVVAILAAIAVPSYQDSIRKTRRGDAKEALTRIAAAQERYFFTNNGYGNFEDLGLSNDPDDLAIESQERYYDVALVGGFDCAGSPCFRVTATAKGAQASDTQCNQLSIDHIGRKTASKYGGGDSSDTCW